MLRRLTLWFAALAWAGQALAGPPVAHGTNFGPAIEANATQIPVPTGFGWTPPWHFYRSAGGVYSTDFNIFNYMPPVGKQYFVNIVTGNNTNAGTRAAPLLSLSTCVAKTDATQCVIMQAGTQAANGAWILWGNRGFAGIGPTVSMSVVVDGGGRAVSVQSPTSVAPTWTLTTGDTYTFQTTISGTNYGCPADLKYLDSNGMFVVGTVVASAAAVESTPNSCYVSGTTLYVHAKDGRSLIGDAYMTALKNGNNGVFNTASPLVYWIANIDFVGGSPFSGQSPSSPTGARPQVYLLNDTFQDSNGIADGITLNGAYQVVMQNCTSANNWDDGFGFHAQSTYGSPLVFEYGDTAFFNGFSNNSDQSSSFHDNTIGITLNPTFHGPANQTIKDIASAQRWVMGGTLYAPVETDAAGNTLSIVGSAWIDGTIIEPAGTYTLDPEGGAIHIRNNPQVYTMTNSHAGGTVSTY